MLRVIYDHFFGEEKVEDMIMRTMYNDYEELDR